MAKFTTVDASKLTPDNLTASHYISNSEPYPPLSHYMGELVAITSGRKGHTNHYSGRLQDVHRHEDRTLTIIVKMDDNKSIVFTAGPFDVISSVKSSIVNEDPAQTRPPATSTRLLNRVDESICLEITRLD